VAGAPAEVVSEPQPDALLRGARFAIEQRLCRHDEAGRAEAALQRGLLEEGALHGVQLLATGDAFNGDDFRSLRLDAEDQAGVYDAPVEDHRAASAVTVVAAFFGAGEPHDIEEAFEEALRSLG